MVTHQSKNSIINRIKQNLEEPHLPESIETVEDIKIFLDGYALYIKKLETAIFDKGRVLSPSRKGGILQVKRRHCGA